MNIGSNSKIGNFFIPIDYTDLKSLIPAGEDIIYSTLCSAAWQQFVGDTRYEQNWVSHVLITPNGVAYILPSIHQFVSMSTPSVVTDSKIKDFMKTYVPWHDVFVHQSRDSDFSHYSTLFYFYRFSDYETEDEHKKRAKDLANDVRDLMILRKEEWLTKNEHNSEVEIDLKNRIRKSLEKLKAKRISTWIKSVKQEIIIPAKKLAKAAKKTKRKNLQGESINIIHKSKELINNIKKKTIEGKGFDDEMNKLKSELNTIKLNFD